MFTVQLNHEISLTLIKEGDVSSKYGANVSITALYSKKNHHFLTNEIKKSKNHFIKSLSLYDHRDLSHSALDLKTFLIHLYEKLKKHPSAKDLLQVSASIGLLEKYSYKPI